MQQQDKQLKKAQKRSEKRIQRRDKEIAQLKKNNQEELQNKDLEIEAVTKQLKNAQATLGGTADPASVCT